MENIFKMFPGLAMKSIQKKMSETKPEKGIKKRDEKKKAKNRRRNQLARIARREQRA